jgi:hypothetical protein
MRGCWYPGSKGLLHFVQGLHEIGKEGWWFVATGGRNSLNRRDAELLQVQKLWQRVCFQQHKGEFNKEDNDS